MLGSMGDAPSPEQHCVAESPGMLTSPVTNGSQPWEGEAGTKQAATPPPPRCLVTGHPELLNCSIWARHSLTPWHVLPERWDGGGRVGAGAGTGGDAAGRRAGRREDTGLLKYIPPGPGRSCWKEALTY